MKDIVLLKGGNYTVNAFADVMEAFNNREDRDLNETLHYYTSSETAAHLHRNTSDQKPDNPLVIAQFTLDPHYPPKDGHGFRFIDMEIMKRAADEYEQVLFAMITSEELLPDFRLVDGAVFIVRDQADRLLNFETGEYLLSGRERVTTATLFSLTKLKGLPVYYLITDPHTVTVGDGYDFEHNDTLYREVTDHDGTLKQALFTPSVDKNSVMINDTIFAKGDTVEISLFSHPHNIFQIEGVSPDLPDINMEVESNFDVDFSNNTLKVNVNSNIGYVKMTPKLGHFCDMSNFENPNLEFVIHKI